MNPGLTVRLILISIFVIAAGALAQTDEPGNEAAANPAQQDTGSGGMVINIEEEPYEYYYWPDEDLDSFGLSTMGENDGGSTLGKTPQRKSNIEANPPRLKPAPEPEDMTGIPDEGTDYEAGPAPGASDSKMYQWVDEKGVLHITNNIGEVPLEYQREYREEGGSGGD